MQYWPHTPDLQGYKEYLAKVNSKRIPIHTPEDVYAITKKYHNKRQEHLILLTLDVAGYLLKVHCIAKGALTTVPFAIRDVFYPAIRDNAVYIILCHNHTDDVLEPSYRDNITAEEVLMASQIMGIRMVDTMIIAKSGFFSFRKDGPAEYRHNIEFPYGFDSKREFFEILRRT